ncbi:unnamed protein product, partial [Polarella glacialis]
LDPAADVAVASRTEVPRFGTSAEQLSVGSAAAAGGAEEALSAQRGERRSTAEEFCAMRQRHGQEWQALHMETHASVQRMTQAIAELHAKMKSRLQELSDQVRKASLQVTDIRMREQIEAADDKLPEESFRVAESEAGDRLSRARADLQDALGSIRF